MEPSEIKALRLSKNLNQTQFGEIFGIGKAAISNWEKGRASPSSAAMKLLNDLKNGDLIVSELSELESKLLEQNVKIGGFKDAEDYLTTSLKHLLTEGSFMSILPSKDTVKAKLNTIEDFPQIQYQVYGKKGDMAAGQPAVNETVGETISIRSLLDPAYHVVFEVNGQSAEPEYMDGDRWLVDIRKKGFTPKKGVPAVFSDTNGCYLKIYQGGNKPFRSVNPDHPDLEAGDMLELVGYPVEKVED